MTATNNTTDHRSAATGAAADLYRRCADVFDEVVEQIGAGQLDRPTPCGSWDVRTVLNHVVGEALWLPVLLSGHTIAEVGDRFAGDLLGRDPVGSWRAADLAAREAATSVDESRPIALSYGTVPAEEYLRQVAADHLVHAWDLAQGLGAPSLLPEDVVVEVSRWFADAEDAYRAAGAIGPRIAVSDDADPQTRLLALFGRQASPMSTDEVITAFGAAFNSHDLEAIMAWTTPDCVFESTAPPAGRRYVGQAAVRSVWAALFVDADEATFTEEQRWVAGDRAVVQWRYDWAGDQPGHVRGVDLFRVRDGLVAEKVSYVKG
jgi:uncharacterized protein (TIGR03086 family)